MSLYLCVFNGDVEVDGVEVGSYADFGRLRDIVLQKLEHGERGSRFPVLQFHSDSNGEWTVEQCALLENELRQVQSELSLHPDAAAESFVDVDGENLFEGLLRLCQLARSEGQPILFQ
jgi:hypothetical protein